MLPKSHSLSTSAASACSEDDDEIEFYDAIPDEVDNIIGDELENSPNTPLSTKLEVAHNINSEEELISKSPMLDISPLEIVQIVEENLEDSIEETIEQAYLNEPETFVSEDIDKEKMSNIQAAVEEAIEESIEAAYLNEPEEMNVLSEELAIDATIDEAFFNEPDKKEFINKENIPTVTADGKDEDNVSRYVDEIEDGIENTIEEALLNEPEEEMELSDDKNADSDNEKSVRERHTEALVQSNNNNEPTTKSSWGGVFSVLADIGSSVKSNADKIYDSFDPDASIEGGSDQVQSPVSTMSESTKSFRGIFDKLSPRTPNSASTTGSGGWMEGIDKTFDRASDRLGQVLLGGFKAVESTVGIAIEPISSSSSVKDESLDDASVQSIPSETSRPSIYASGLSALGRLGRTTAGYVTSTKDRLTPLLDTHFKSNLNSSPSILERDDLKKSFSILFDELSGNEALEKIMIRSSQFSVMLKTQMKTLNSTQLAPIVASLKPVGSLLDNLETLDGPFEFPPLQNLFPVREEEIASSHKGSIERSVENIVSIDEEVIEEWRAKVNSPLPPDTTSLLLYILRFNLACLLSGSLFLCCFLDFEMTPVEESDVAQLARWLLNALTTVESLKDSDLIDTSRRAAFNKLLAEDLDMAKSILHNATLKLQPMLKWSKYNSLQ